MKIKFLQKQKVVLDINKTISGNIIINDSPDYEIMINPKNRKIITFPKGTFSDGNENDQLEFFNFLRRQSAIKHDSVQGGYVFGSYDALYPEGEEENSLNYLLYCISEFFKVKLPELQKKQDYLEKRKQFIYEPDDENSTDLGDVPHEERKGSIHHDLRQNYSYSYFLYEGKESGAKIKVGQKDLQRIIREEYEKAKKMGLTLKDNDGLTKGIKKVLKEGVVQIEKYIDSNTLKKIEETFRRWIELLNESYPMNPMDTVRYGTLKFSYLDVAKNKKNVDLSMIVMVDEGAKTTKADLKTSPNKPEKAALTVFLPPKSMPLNNQQIESYINTVMNHELVHLLDTEQTKGDAKKEYWKQKSELAAYTTQIYKEVERFLKSENPMDKWELQDYFGMMRASGDKGRVFSSFLEFASPKFKEMNRILNLEKWSWEKNPQLNSWYTNMYKKFWPLFQREMEKLDDQEGNRVSKRKYLPETVKDFKIKQEDLQRIILEEYEKAKKLGLTLKDNKKKENK